MRDIKPKNTGSCVQRNWMQCSNPNILIDINNMLNEEDFQGLLIQISLFSSNKSKFSYRSFLDNNSIQVWKNMKVSKQLKNVCVNDSFKVLDIQYCHSCPELEWLNSPHFTLSLDLWVFYQAWSRDVSLPTLAECWIKDAGLDLSFFLLFSHQVILNVRSTLL